MPKNMKTRKGKDGFSYPYTSPDLVIDRNGKSNTKKFEEISSQFKDIAKKTITTEERNKLTNLENYDDTSIKNKLNEKADKNEVRYKNVELNLNDFDESSRSALTGSDYNLNYVFGIQSVKTSNVAEKSITPTKLYGISLGKNIYHKYNCIYDKYISSTGKEDTLSGYIISDYQEKIPNTDYTVSSYGGEVIVAYYNSSCEYQKQDKCSAVDCLKGVVINNEYPIFRLSHNKNTPRVMMEMGNTKVDTGDKKNDYEDFCYYFNSDLKIRELDNINKELDNINKSLNKSNEYNNNKEPYDYDLQYIYNNRLFATDSGKSTTAKYATATLSDKPNKMMAKVIFTSGRIEGSFDLISNPNGTDGANDICKSSIHIVFMANCVQIGVWITENNVRKLKILSAPTYSISQDGKTEYTIGWELNGNVLTVYKPDGTTYKETNDLFISNNGKYVTYEHYWSGSEKCRTIATRIEAYVNGQLEFWDNFKRPDGILTRSSSGHDYVLKKEINV